MNDRPVDTPEEDSRGRRDVYDFESMVKRARNNPGPRKHHLIPASYLARWASRNRLRVTEIDSNRWWEADPTKVARETDYYRLESPQIDPVDTPPLLIETLLSQVEGDGKTAIDELLKAGVVDLSRQGRTQLATFLAFQLIRGEQTRDQLRQMPREHYGRIYGNLDDDGIRFILTKMGRESTVDAVAAFRREINDPSGLKSAPELDQSQLIMESARYARDYAEDFYARNWVIFETRGLLTCDEPVVRIGGPGLPRVFPAGTAIAHVIIFPLAPHALLAMFRPGFSPSSTLPLTVAETGQVNREILANTHRWAFDQPGRDTATRLPVPSRPVRPVVVEAFTAPSGHNEMNPPIGTPTRWAGASNPPDWPVRRWYR